MENATKALVIAGSILIAIALIAIGVRVFGETQGPADQVKGAMSTTEISIFNSKFLAYAGTNKSGAEMKSLVNLTIANNATTNTMVTIKYIPKLETETSYNTKTEIQNFITVIKNEKFYTVSFEYNDLTGCVGKIIITEQ